MQLIITKKEERMCLCGGGEKIKQSKVEETENEEEQDRVCVCAREQTNKDNNTSHFQETNLSGFIFISVPYYFILIYMN